MNFFPKSFQSSVRRTSVTSRSSRPQTNRLHAATSLAVLATMAIFLALPQAQVPSAAPARSATSDPLSMSSQVTRTIASTQVTAEPRATGKWSIKVRDWRRTFARGDQDRIDRCQATLWWGPYPGKASGTSWLAGHNYCGFWRWDKWLQKGSTFKIKSPTGTVRVYRVYARGYVDRHGGSSAGLIEGDLTLITCRGKGTSFTYAKLIDVR